MVVEVQSLHRQAADLLIRAYASGVPIEPLSTLFPTLEVDDAYEIQRHLHRSWAAAGRTIVGHKIGLTSAAIQQQLGVNQPDFGVLLADLGHRSADTIDLDQLIAPRVEPELALVLGADLTGANVSPEQAWSCVGEVRAALEVIDSRIVDWRIGLVDTVADNASSGRWVLAVGGVTPDAIDPAAVPCTMSRNGRPATSGTSVAVLGSPAHSLAWLATTLCRRGVPLRAGDVVLSGGITAAIPVVAGDEVRADFGGVGTVLATFSGAGPERAPTRPTTHHKGADDV